jgi:succinylglutamate desuccinylase
MEVMETPEPPLTAVDRVLGRLRGPERGPTLLCIGGLHGNEPAGVQALKRVLRRLEPRASHMSGEVVALLGNRAACAAGRRFVDRDLNRAWTGERIWRLTNRGVVWGDVEDREQVELLNAIEDVVEMARGAVYVLDLHTTSGFGGPFTTFGDTLPNRDFASHIPVPMVLGLEELVEGTLLGFLASHGLVTVAYESGQHDEDLSVDRAEAGIWLAVAAAGLLPEHLLPEARAAHALLARESKGLPKALEMRYRHDIEPEDRFEMAEGWRNFQRVEEGSVLGSDATGAVRAVESGRILMPLYQEQGEDGFFLIREFRPMWLQVSTLLRTLRLDRFVHWLPGVRHDSWTPDSVLVDTRVARWYAPQVLHLLGYKKQGRTGAHLVMRRRQYDEYRFVRQGPTPEHVK